MIFMRDGRTPALVVVARGVFWVSRVDARPRTSNVVLEVWFDEGRERVFVFCREVLGAWILRVTLAEVALPLVVPAKVDRFDLLEDALLALPGVIVLELRLAPLLEGFVTVCLCDATERLLVGVLATSTVRLTGRERVALL